MSKRTWFKATNGQWTQLFKRSIRKTVPLRKWRPSRCVWLINNGRLESYSITELQTPWGCQEVKSPRFQDSRHMKVVKLSALRTDRLYLQQIPLLLKSVTGSAVSNNPIRNRTRDLPACGAEPRAITPPCALYENHIQINCSVTTFEFNTHLCGLDIHISKLR